jgi:hypothetical protein
MGSLYFDSSLLGDPASAGVAVGIAPGRGNNGIGFI